MPVPIAGIDPHQDNFTVAVIDPVGVELGHHSYENSAAGYLEAIDFLGEHLVESVGVEGSASWGAHIAIALVSAGFDCREVPAQRSAIQRRARRADKTDTVDAYSAARALQAEPHLGPVQTLEVYDPLVAKIEAVLEHRKALVELRVLALHYARTNWRSSPPRSVTSSPRPARSSRGCVTLNGSTSTS